MSAFNRRLALPKIAGVSLPTAIGLLIAATSALLAVTTSLVALWFLALVSVGIALWFLSIGDDLMLWRLLLCARREAHLVAREQSQC